MPHKRPAFDLQHLRELYEAGSSIERLAKRHHVGQGWLKKQLIAAGVHVRTFGEASRLRWRFFSRTKIRRMLAPAHRACRGRKRTTTEKQASAHARMLTLHRKLTFARRYEGQFRQLLIDRGGPPGELQMPIHGYNIDIGFPTVAVEIHGSANHPLTDARYRKRVKKLVDTHHVIYVWVTVGHPLGEGAADEVIRLLQIAQRDPASRGQYWVIRGSGEHAPLRRHYDDFP